jgi:hypothetical protein
MSRTAVVSSVRFGYDADRPRGQRAVLFRSWFPYRQRANRQPETTRVQSG